MAAGAAHRHVQWIDDPKRSDTTHADVPVSPMTRRQTVERPPTPSYSALRAAPGWHDLYEGASVGRGGAGRRGARMGAGASRLGASLRRPKSAGAVPAPARHRTTTPDDVGTILRRRNPDGTLTRPRSAPASGRLKRTDREIEDAAPLPPGSSGRAGAEAQAQAETQVGASDGHARENGGGQLPASRSRSTRVGPPNDAGDVRDYREGERISRGTTDAGRGDSGTGTGRQ